MRQLLGDALEAPDLHFKCRVLNKGIIFVPDMMSSLHVIDLKASFFFSGALNMCHKNSHTYYF
jgi:hypothetical protein